MIEEEEFFSQVVWSMEVERIIISDENEMDMSVLSHHKALDLKTENEAEDYHQKGLLLGDEDYTDNTSFLDEERPWDPENNVR